MKRALLVGVDSYRNFSDLAGCVNDVSAMKPLLARNDDDTVNFDCITRTSEFDAISRESLIGDITELLRPGADVSLLYFAGHGQGQWDYVALCTADGTQVTPGLAFSEILGMVQRSTVGEVIVMLDCCFAGAAGGVPPLGAMVSVLRNGTSILSASRGDQTSAETPAGRGVFSSFLCGGLEGGAADVMGRVTIAGLYAYLDESFGPWDQRPVLRANVDRLHELRRCHPAVPLGHLHQLPRLFPDPMGVLPLDPSYEPTEDPRDADHEADFKVLQDCRDAKLVEVVDAPHMYGAAMGRTGCRLTQLGRHYREIVEKGRL